MDMDNSVVIAVVGRGWVEVKEDIRSINGNGKNTIKINEKKIKLETLKHRKGLG